MAIEGVIEFFFRVNLAIMDMHRGKEEAFCGLRIRKAESHGMHRRRFFAEFEYRKTPVFILGKLLPDFILEFKAIIQPAKVRERGHK